ncbi:MAG: hypothetical protein ACPGUD_08080 [Parashewanella sp.]
MAAASQSTSPQSQYLTLDTLPNFTDGNESVILKINDQLYQASVTKGQLNFNAVSAASFKASLSKLQLFEVASRADKTVAVSELIQRYTIEILASNAVSATVAANTARKLDIELEVLIRSSPAKCCQVINQLHQLEANADDTGMEGLVLESKQTKVQTLEFLGEKLYDLARLNPENALALIDLIDPNGKSPDYRYYVLAQGLERELAQVQYTPCMIDNVPQRYRQDMLTSEFAEEVLNRAYQTDPVNVLLTLCPTTNEYKSLKAILELSNIEELLQKHFSDCGANHALCQQLIQFRISGSVMNMHPVVRLLSAMPNEEAEQIRRNILLQQMMDELTMPNCKAEQVKQPLFAGMPSELAQKLIQSDAFSVLLKKETVSLSGLLRITDSADDWQLMITIIGEQKICDLFINTLSFSHKLALCHDIESRKAFTDPEPTQNVIAGSIAFSVLMRLPKQNYQAVVKELYVAVIGEFLEHEAHLSLVNNPLLTHLPDDLKAEILASDTVAIKIKTIACCEPQRLLLLSTNKLDWQQFIKITGWIDFLAAFASKLDFNHEAPDVYDGSEKSFQLCQQLWKVSGQSYQDPVVRLDATNNDLSMATVMQLLPDENYEQLILMVLLTAIPHYVNRSDTVKPLLESLPLRVQQLLFNDTRFKNQLSDFVDEYDLTCLLALSRKKENWQRFVDNVEEYKIKKWVSNLNQSDADQLRQLILINNGFSSLPNDVCDTLNSKLLSLLPVSYYQLVVNELFIGAFQRQIDNGIPKADVSILEKFPSEFRETFLAKPEVSKMIEDASQSNKLLNCTTSPQLLARLAQKLDYFSLLANEPQQPLAVWEAVVVNDDFIQYFNKLKSEDLPKLLELIKCCPKQLFRSLPPIALATLLANDNVIKTIKQDPTNWLCIENQPNFTAELATCIDEHALALTEIVASLPADQPNCLYLCQNLLASSSIDFDEASRLLNALPEQVWCDIECNPDAFAQFLGGELASSSFEKMHLVIRYLQMKKYSLHKKLAVSVMCHSLENDSVLLSDIVKYVKQQHFAIWSDKHLKQVGPSLIQRARLNDSFMGVIYAFEMPCLDTGERGTLRADQLKATDQEIAILSILLPQALARQKDGVECAHLLTQLAISGVGGLIKHNSFKSQVLVSCIAQFPVASAKFIRLHCPTLVDSMDELYFQACLNERLTDDQLTALATCVNLYIAREHIPEELLSNLWIILNSYPQRMIAYYKALPGTVKSNIPNFKPDCCKMIWGNQAIQGNEFITVLEEASEEELDQFISWLALANRSIIEKDVNVSQVMVMCASSPIAALKALEGLKNAVANNKNFWGNIKPFNDVQLTVLVSWLAAISYNYPAEAVKVFSSLSHEDQIKVLHSNVWQQQLPYNLVRDQQNDNGQTASYLRVNLMSQLTIEAQVKLFAKINKTVNGQNSQASIAIIEQQILHECHKSNGSVSASSIVSKDEDAIVDDGWDVVIASRPGLSTNVCKLLKTVDSSLLTERSMTALLATQDPATWDICARCDVVTLIKAAKNCPAQNLLPMLSHYNCPAKFKELFLQDLQWVCDAYKVAVPEWNTSYSSAQLLLTEAPVDVQKAVLLQYQPSDVLQFATTEQCSKTSRDLITLEPQLRSHVLTATVLKNIDSQNSAVIMQILAKMTAIELAEIFKNIDNAALLSIIQNPDCPEIVITAIQQDTTLVNQFVTPDNLAIIAESSAPRNIKILQTFKDRLDVAALNRVLMSCLRADEVSEEKSASEVNSLIEFVAGFDTRTILASVKLCAPELKIQLLRLLTTKQSIQWLFPTVDMVVDFVKDLNNHECMMLILQGEFAIDSVDSAPCIPQGSFSQICTQKQHEFSNMVIENPKLLSLILDSVYPRSLPNKLYITALVLACASDKNSANSDGSLAQRREIEVSQARQLLNNTSLQQRDDIFEQVDDDLKLFILKLMFTSKGNGEWIASKLNDVGASEQKCELVYQTCKLKQLPTTCLIDLFKQSPVVATDYLILKDIDEVMAVLGEHKVTVIELLHVTAATVKWVLAQESEKGVDGNNVSGDLVDLFLGSHVDELVQFYGDSPADLVNGLTQDIKVSQLFIWLISCGKSVITEQVMALLINEHKQLQQSVIEARTESQQQQNYIEEEEETIEQIKLERVTHLIKTATPEVVSAGCRQLSFEAVWAIRDCYPEIVAEYIAGSTYTEYLNLIPLSASFKTFELFILAYNNKFDQLAVIAASVRDYGKDFVEYMQCRTPAIDPSRYLMAIFAKTQGKHRQAYLKALGEHATIVTTSIVNALVRTLPSNEKAQNMWAILSQSERLTVHEKLKKLDTVDANRLVDVLKV